MSYSNINLWYLSCRFEHLSTSTYNTGRIYKGAIATGPPVGGAYHYGLDYKPEIVVKVILRVLGWS